MRGVNRGQFSQTSTQDFFVLNGILVLRLVDAVLGALAIQAGRRAAWWPTLISLAGLGLWGYAVFTGWQGTVWSPF